MTDGEEAADVAAPERLIARVRGGIARIFVFLVALGLTAVTSQEVARRYSERQQAVEVKAGAITAVNRSSVRAYGEALDVVSAAVQQISPRILGEKRNRVLRHWSDASAEVDGTIFVYFDQAPAKEEWHRFQGAMLGMLSLSHVDRNQEARALTGSLRAYLPATTYRPIPPSVHDPWATLNCVLPDCRESEEWFESFRWLGRRVLRERGTVMRSLADAKATILRRGG